MSEIRIAGRRVGRGSPVYLIADVGANHDGSLERALELIELAAAAGADAVKFQNFIASKIVSPQGFAALGDKVAHQSAWDRPVIDVYAEASVPQDWTPLLADRCRAAGVDYFTTPYDLETVDAVDRHVPAYKVGSGDITWPAILRQIAAKGKPVLLATGASSQDDVDRAVDVLREHTDALLLMQCNTNYMGDPETLHHVNLAVLRDWADRYPDLVLGLSDHTPGHVAACAAVALGACAIEKHFTDDTARAGPDHAFAMDPLTWRAMTDAVRATEAAMGDGVKRIEPNEREAAIVQRRALRFARDLPAGHRLGPDDVFPTRPCPPDGIPPYRVAEVLGGTLAVAVAEDSLVTAAQFA